MLSKLSGMLSAKDTKTKQKWAKIAIALILSNLFFFLLFSRNEDTLAAPPGIPDGWVEVQIRADLLTPFQDRKKVLLVNRRQGGQLEGVLQQGTDPEGKLTVLVKESEAQALFQHESWEVLPYIRNLKLRAPQRGESYEIRY
jgi:hypothetical protein